MPQQSSQNKTANASSIINESSINHTMNTSHSRKSNTKAQEFKDKILNLERALEINETAK